MIVRDIFLRAQEVTGVADEATNFEWISDAVETLSNKGLIDAMQGYVEIPVTSDRIVTLPRDVEVPVKVNVGNNPSFSRTKLHEFTINGPGSDYTPTDWSWEDKGEVPVSKQPESPTKIIVQSSNQNDDGLVVRIWGRREIDNKEVMSEVELNYAAMPVTSNTFYVITRVIKPATLGGVTLIAQTGNNPISVYSHDETEPAYRQIKLSQAGTTAHILFRRSVYRISSQDDWIPIQSRMGLYLMLRAVKFYRLATPQDLQTAMALEKQAEAFVAEEQKSRNIFSEVASQTELDSAMGLNVNNRDSIIASDIYDDACRICGPIGRQKVFDRITEAIELLANKGQWDGAGYEGYIDISTIDSNIVTLPRYVDYVLALNVGNSPARMRNRWYEFHLNGPGSECSQSCSSWTDMGETVTLVDLTEAQRLVYQTESGADNGKTITVYGYDEDDRPVTLTYAGSNAVGQASVPTTHVSRIERITREATSGFTQLMAYSTDGESTQIGYYWPDETEPNYKRIKIPCSACYVRIRYRKRTRKITSLSDQIHLRSKLAIKAALRAIQAAGAEKPDLQAAQALEMKAVQLLTEEKTSHNPAEVFNIQVSFPGSNSEYGQY